MKGKKCVVFDFEQNEQEERIKCKELYEKFIHSTKWIIYELSCESGAESWFCELIQFVSKTVNNFAHVRHIIWRIRVVFLFFARSIENDNFFHFIQRTTVFSTMTKSLSSMNTLMFCCCFLFIWKNELYIFFWKTFVPFSRYVSPVTVAARCISPFNILSSLLFVSTVKTNYNN